jgi:uncharacterized RDD family membrane protein YckC|tara:strand:+ start:148 stop:711 length:564 start_codon:yes stop_codon:yes gene_type:complete
MDQPPEIPSSAEIDLGISRKPAPAWVRLLAGAADAIVAGLFSLAIIIFFLIPVFYPETQTILYEYTERATESLYENSELARQLLENSAVQSMVVASQVINFSLFFFYYLLNEWILRGSSFGKKIFGIKTVKRNPDEALSPNTMLLRAWIKTLFLLFHPILWITFIWAVFQKERRSVHDLITGTWVID